MHLFLAAEDTETHLRDELLRAFPTVETEILPARLLLTKGLPPATESVGHLAFVRQFLPDATFVSAHSIRDWSNLLLEAVLPALPDHQPWRLHLLPRYGNGNAGRHRLELIGATLDELLQRRRRGLRRQLVTDLRPFDPGTSLVQLILTAPDRAFLAVSVAPVPHVQRAVMSPFPAGEIPPAVDKDAPSRAFAKLVEAELRLGRAIAAGESCVDLGAAPGSWTHVALRRKATVHAVDRSPLREDLMRDPRLVFHQSDAFKFTPESRVDWLLCDVIAAPDRSIDLVVDWAARRLCRRFVVTIKFKGESEYPILDRLKVELPPHCVDFLLTRLSANKNEVCVLGEVRE